MSPGQAALLLSLLKPKSLSAVETASQSEPLSDALVSDEAFWRNVFAALAENGMI